VIVMVYAGLLNKQIVSQLQAMDCNAIGLSGADGDLIRAHKRKVKDIDYGYAGDIDQVNAQALSQLIGTGFTPVFCAVTHDHKGQLLNTNADTIASSIARAMTGHFSVSLKLCFEKDGVLSDPKNEKSVIRQIDRQDYQDYCKKGTISEGMIPKMDNAFEALSEGVLEVVIGSPESMSKGEATRLV
jgi:acetylglutamate kinase